MSIPKVSLLTSILLLVVVMTAAAAEFKIDADFPGGNIVVKEIDGDNVRLDVDLRDTSEKEFGGKWFYWSFRIRGAEGRTLNFEFTPVLNGPIGARGPAISNDGGYTWRWLSDSPGFARTKFQYTFTADEKDVLFSTGMNYTEKNLKRFLEKHKGSANLKLETLCKSKKGRDVELLRIPGKGNAADFKIALTARHHCCEMMANYVLEGIIETTLSDTDDGKWLREHCDFFIVPFVDRDGVEDGDQGKNRKPHDHNRDYVQRIYPEVKAITEQVPAWQNEKPILWVDLHCPMLRNGRNDAPLDKVSEESLQLYGTLHEAGTPLEECWKIQQRFSKILEAEQKGTIPYKQAFILNYHSSRAQASARMGSPNILSSCLWAATLPNIIFAATLETPYANASNAVVDADSGRALGRDFAHAIHLCLKEEFERRRTSSGK
ncbi:MAG: hypothetical protein FWE67_05400 [Planctomycetaceae bacterium]|nr:hypothetical protein [Planctomycetaceae bacterium]